jgi:hypothetical protein
LLISEVSFTCFFCLLLCPLIGAPSLLSIEAAVEILIARELAAEIEIATGVLQKISYLCTYDLYSHVHNVLDVCISITRESGRGLGPGN